MGLAAQLLSVSFSQVKYGIAIGSNGHFDPLCGSPVGLSEDRRVERANEEHRSALVHHRSRGLWEVLLCGGADGGPELISFGVNCSVLISLTAKVIVFDGVRLYAP